MLARVHLCVYHYMPEQLITKNKVTKKASCKAQADGTVACGGEAKRRVCVQSAMSAKAHFDGARVLVRSAVHRQHGPWPTFL